MSKFQSAVHNIGHHAVSGLCDLLAEGYAYCENEGIELLTINLLSTEAPFPAKLKNEVEQLKQKAESILTTTCGVEQEDIEYAVLSVDYRISDKSFQRHKAQMKSIGVWYGHDPLYEAVIEYRLKNGTVARCEFSNGNGHKNV